MAEAATKAADDILVELALTHAKQDHSAEAELLLDLSKKINDGGPGGWGYMTHPQSEWTGGDSSLSENFTLREPNIINMGKRFPREDVDAERSREEQ